MKKVFFLTLVMLSQCWATMMPPSSQSLAQNCYPSSPMLYSDVCWGKTYSDQSSQQNAYFPGSGAHQDPLAEIYQLLNSGAFGQVDNSNQMQMFGSLFNQSQPQLWNQTNPNQGQQTSSYLSQILK